MALERRSNWRLFATCVCGLECATWQEECETVACNGIGPLRADTLGGPRNKERPKPTRLSWP